MVIAEEHLAIIIRTIRAGPTTALALKEEKPVEAATRGMGSGECPRVLFSITINRLRPTQNNHYNHHHYQSPLSSPSSLTPSSPRPSSLPLSSSSSLLLTLIENLLCTGNNVKSPSWINLHKLSDINMFIIIPGFFLRTWMLHTYPGHISGVSKIWTLSGWLKDLWTFDQHFTMRGSWRIGAYISSHNFQNDFLLTHTRSCGL